MSNDSFSLVPVNWKMESEGLKDEDWKEENRKVEVSHKS